MFGGTFISPRFGQGINMYIHNSKKSQLYTCSEGHLVLPLSVAVFDEVSTQFKEKEAIHLGIFSIDSRSYMKLAKGCLIPVTEFDEVCHIL